MLAYLADEPGAGEDVRALVEDPVRTPGISVVNAAEVVDRLSGQAGVPADEAVADVVQTGCCLVDVDDGIALLAGALRSRHYRRRDRPVGLADCVAAATALRSPLVTALATSDRHLLDVVFEEGGQVHPLPASDGSRHVPGGDGSG
ncbi:MAG: PIN domain-containing protein [Kineosporiaceae bacterium]